MSVERDEDGKIRHNIPETTPAESIFSIQVQGVDPSRPKKTYHMERHTQLIQTERCEQNSHMSSSACQNGQQIPPIALSGLASSLLMMYLDCRTLYSVIDGKQVNTAECRPTPQSPPTFPHHLTLQHSQHPPSMSTIRPCSPAIPRSLPPPRLL